MSDPLRTLHDTTYYRTREDSTMSDTPTIDTSRYAHPEDIHVHENGVVELDPTERVASVCGTCGRAWDDDVVTGWTPAPAGRCPFEYEHGGDEDDETPAVEGTTHVIVHYTVMVGLTLDADGTIIKVNQPSTDSEWPGPDGADTFDEDEEEWRAASDVEWKAGYAALQALGID